jgi:hypothetical protein
MPPLPSKVGVNKGYYPTILGAFPRMDKRQRSLKFYQGTSNLSADLAMANTFTKLSIIHSAL